MPGPEIDAAKFINLMYPGRAPSDFDYQAKHLLELWGILSAEEIRTPNNKDDQGDPMRYIIKCGLTTIGCVTGFESHVCRYEGKPMITRFFTNPLPGSSCYPRMTSMFYSSYIFSFKYLIKTSADHPYPAGSEHFLLEHYIFFVSKQPTLIEISDIHQVLFSHVGASAGANCIVTA